MGNNNSSNSTLIYDETLSSYNPGDSHPMQPIRLSYVAELLQAYNVFETPGISMIKPESASEIDLLTFHTPNYINAIKNPNTHAIDSTSNQFNIGYGDNPIFPNMYSLANLIVGSSILAAKHIYSGKHDTVFNIAGGLHHAMPNNASGFCIFNDPVIAINALLGFGLKPAYIDIDCHHGDGVQQAFYETDQVLTISIHESGKYIFPGTGFIDEIGRGSGKGYSINIPLHPYTNDAVYIEMFKNIVPKLIELFAPDVIVAQLGIDTHYTDPLTHLSLTTQGHSHLVETIKKFGYPILALGGGGYNLQAVSRGWANAFAILSNYCLPDDIPDIYKSKYQVSTISDKLQPELPSAMSKTVNTVVQQNLLYIENTILPLLKNNV
jgi:acetoin utilization protein AcuC